MAGFTTLMLLQHVVFAANPPSYLAALQDAQAQHRPLLVLVGADWCPGCQTMKHSVLPGLAQRGGLRTVSFVTVDADAEPELSRQLMSGPSIPQLVIFCRKPNGEWHREQLTGESSEYEIKSLIARAVKLQQGPVTELVSSPIGN